MRIRYVGKSQSCMVAQDIANIAANEVADCLHGGDTAEEIDGLTLHGHAIRLIANLVCAHPNCRCNVSHAWFLNYPLQEPEELAKLPGTMKALGMAEAMLAEDEARRNFR